MWGNKARESIAIVVFRALQSSFLLMEMYMGRWLLIHEEVLMMLPRNYR